MDDLGNRTGSQTLNDTTVNFTVDDDTNRYTSVGGNTISHDDAGNLTVDKDGYTYEYDYENRIVKIEKPTGPTTTATVAEYAYDALGRRIRQVDSIASETTLYYYNPEWQVLAEYDNANNQQRYFIYGNYIDEPLVMCDDATAGDPDYYYAHDHLFSTVALINASGTVTERYEYDAYGKMTRLDPDFTTWSGTEAGNPYYFTSRRRDQLDSNNLELMYYRHRYDDTYTGRFLQHDPLGINPAGGPANPFGIHEQYGDGMSLYGYLASSPVNDFDPFGLESYGWIGAAAGRHKCPLSYYSATDPKPHLRFGWRREIEKRGGLMTAFRIGWHDVLDVYFRMKRQGCCCYDHMAVYDHGWFQALGGGEVLGNQCWGTQYTSGPRLTGKILRDLCPFLCDNIQLELLGCYVGSGTRAGFAMLFGACKKISSIKACRGLTHWNRDQGLTGCDGGWKVFHR